MRPAYLMIHQKSDVGVRNIMDAEVFVSLQYEAGFPDLFPSPFDARPAEVAAQAAKSLQSRLPDMCDHVHRFDSIDGGKMFGVLVVRLSNGETGYLSAFSGMLGNKWHHNGFAPPVFDVAERKTHQENAEAQIIDLSDEIKNLQTDEAYLTAQECLQSVDTKSLATIESFKQRCARRKSKRGTLRRQDDVDDNTLEILANESRADKLEFKNLKHRLQEDSRELRLQVAQFDDQIDYLKIRRQRVSRKLQRKLFEAYELTSVDGNTAVMSDLFSDALPPSGAGDCAAVKLMQYANLHHLMVIALAEFWWGAAPLGGLREHGRYYPACRSRCRVLLPHLLQGVRCTTPAHEKPVLYSEVYPRTLYEDHDIVVVEKPAGLLSVPGKVLSDSVEARLKARYPEVAGVMLLHRLDQATSGVMIAAKNPHAYKSLQHQFQDRTIKKRYVAVLDGVLSKDNGIVDLPLRIDIYDRPRQIVCHERGKSATTRFEIIASNADSTRIAFFPRTGRTHQLRVHAAHKDGLNCPILGDELYGRPLERLHLHAEEISFTHPVSGCRLAFASKTPF